MNLRAISVVAVTSLVAVFALSVPADAAEYTDLLNAADDFDDDDPETFKAWDFHIEPTFRFDYGTAQISREAPCVPQNHPSIQDNPLVDRNPRLVRDRDRCDEPRIVTNREMDYQHTRSTVDLTLRAGLYKDLELRVTVPFVLSSTRSLKYSNEDARADRRVDENNSSVDPSNDRIRNHAEDVFSPTQSDGAYVSALDQYQMYRFFDLGDDYSTYERSGLADPSVGIHWAPWNDYRDDTKATMLIGFDYTMPVAELERHDNTAVGRGIHELAWKIAASKRFGFVEPYFGAQYFLPIAAADTLYGKVDSGADGRGEGQVLRNPPHKGLFTVGAEFVPYEDAETGARYGIDLRFEFGYTSEGRDYTPLFDHMTDPDNPCNGLTLSDVRPDFDGNGNLTNPEAVACSWVVQQPSNSSPASYDLRAAIDSDPNREFAFTDLMSVDSYATFAGQFGLYLQPTRYFQFRGVVGLTHHQAHLLTNARTGRDTPETTTSSVDMTSGLERNPAYNPAYDNSGDRFQIERYNTWHFMVTTALQF